MNSGTGRHRHLDKISVAKALLDFYGDNPKRWTQGETARTSRGRVVSPTDPEAVRFCLFGATMKLEIHYKEDFRQACGGSPMRFNDDKRRTFKSVIRRLREIAEGKR